MKSGKFKETNDVSRTIAFQPLLSDKHNTPFKTGKKTLKNKLFFLKSFKEELI